MIDALAYDPVVRELDVTFKNGSVYRYHDVPQQVYDQVRSAPSVGGAFVQSVKNSYPWTRV
jgi:hypothetical protein